MIFVNRLISEFQMELNTFHNALFFTPATMGDSSTTYTHMDGASCACYDIYNCQIALGIHKCMLNIFNCRYDLQVRIKRIK
jgi:hypothetical protein